MENGTYRKTLIIGDRWLGESPDEGDQERSYFDSKLDKEIDDANVDIANEEQTAKQVYEATRQSIIDDFLHDYDNVLVLSGAGSSISTKKIGNETEVPQDETGSTMSSLAKSVNGYLEDHKELNLSKMASVAKFKGSGEDDEFDHFEDLLTQIERAKDFIPDTIKDKYMKSRDTIYREIKKLCSLKYNEERHSHFKLIKRLQFLNGEEKRLKIYTTNYDTLFEQAAETHNYIINDGFSYYPGKSRFNDEIFDWDFVIKDSDSSSQKLEYVSNVIKVFKLHGSINWRRGENDVFKIASNENASEGGVDSSVMIFPRSNKYEQSYELPFFDLFARFQQDLRRKNTLLIVVGFSFGDMHIRQIVLNALESNPNLNMIYVDLKISEEEGDQENFNQQLKDFHAHSDRTGDVLFLRETLSEFANQLPVGTMYGGKEDKDDEAK